MKAAANPYRTDFYMWSGVSALFFSHAVTGIHSHNTMQVIVDLHDRFKCRINDEEWKTYKNLVIRENVIHQLNTNNSVQLLIYLDAGSTLAKTIKARFMDGADVYAPDVDVLKEIDPQALQQTILHPDAERLLNLVNNVLAIFSGEHHPPKADERISRVKHFIGAQHPDDLSVKKLAEIAFLSESRLRVLFKEETGIPIYQYILWARIRYATNLIMNGSAIQEAALEAGFTDSSHLHKLMVKMFGISPSQFIKSNQQFNIIICDSVPLNFVSNVYNRNGGLEKVYR